MQCLGNVSQIIHVEPATLQDPILRLTYEPSPPAFTIRNIVSALVLSSSPPFKVTVHKTLSLEDRARLLHTKEKQSLLYRLGFAFLVAIPTFIIGVLFMSLVSPENPTKKFLMEPMWSGNASRIQWSLFFLATPVMFYSAGGFHRRSLKEIHALWGRGSRTPILQRFLRFGSMNLLVCFSSRLRIWLTKNIADIFWNFSGIFLLHCLACPRSVEYTIQRWSWRHLDVFRLRGFSYNVPSYRYAMWLSQGRPNLILSQANTWKRIAGATQGMPLIAWQG